MALHGDSHMLRIQIRPKSSKGSVVVILGRAVEAHVQPVDARALRIDPGRTAAAKRAHANKGVRATMGMRVGLYRGALGRVDARGSLAHLSPRAFSVVSSAWPTATQNCSSWEVGAPRTKGAIDAYVSMGTPSEAHGATSWASPPRLAKVAVARPAHEARWRANGVGSAAVPTRPGAAMVTISKGTCAAVSRVKGGSSQKKAEPLRAWGERRRAAVSGPPRRPSRSAITPSAMLSGLLESVSSARARHTPPPSLLICQMSQSVWSPSAREMTSTSSAVSFAPAVVAACGGDPGARC